MTNYYLKPKGDLKNRVTERQDRELTVLDESHPKFHKYQTEYKIHHWMPPAIISPPRDNSIEDLIIDGWHWQP